MNLNNILWLANLPIYPLFDEKSRWPPLLA